MLDTPDEIIDAMLTRIKAKRDAEKQANDEQAKALKRRRRKR